MKINNKIAIGGMALLLGVAGCTKLDEKLRQDQNVAQTGGSVDVNGLIQSAYIQMQLPYQDQAQLWAAQEHTSDEAMGPTRGGDWDDNGIWRALHNHKWDADHIFLANTFRELGRVIFTTTDALQYNSTPAQKAEIRFIRAFVMFAMVDGWGVVPLREPGGSYSDNPKVLKGVEAINFIIAEVNAILNDLPATGPANKANRNAARVLLMKLYLNKGAFANRQAPVFANDDMVQVNTLADQIIGSGTYSLSNNVFTNFYPNNDAISTENIFTHLNIGGSRSGNVRSRWFCTMHYNQRPSSWNGFVTLADFYDKFEAGDQRRGQVINLPGGPANPGNRINTGFLIGQQYDLAVDTQLNDRKGNKLSFSRDVKIKETGNDLEVKGIRVVKYPIDYVSGDNANNDYVFYRYADVVLMKAEALLRQSSPNAAAALTLVNSVRTKRGASSFASIDLDKLIDERGREFYWEGMRRQDLIRFGKFLLPWAEKPTDDPRALYFPIPNRELATNPNLTQNPGYN
jgi:starch-binding outer membrane protein, SusD/RagB family